MLCVGWCADDAHTDQHGGGHGGDHVDERADKHADEHTDEHADEHVGEPSMVKSLLVCVWLGSLTGVLMMRAPWAADA